MAFCGSRAFRLQSRGGLRAAAFDVPSCYGTVFSFSWFAMEENDNKKPKSAFRAVGIDFRTLEKKACPLSGLPVYGRPEWTDMDCGEECFLTVRLLGKRILLCEPWGKANGNEFEKAAAIIEEIAREAFGDAPCVQIEDFSRLSGVKSNAYNGYIGLLAKRKNLLSVVFYGLPFSLRMRLYFAGMAKKVQFDRLAVKNYQEAVEGALSSLEKAKAGRRSSTAPKIVGKKWVLELENYCLRFETIGLDTIFSSSKGYVRESFFPAISSLRKKVARYLVERGEFNYFVVDMDGLHGLDFSVRKTFTESFIEFYEEYPFKVLFYLENTKFIKTGVKLVAHQMPFPIRPVRSLDEALRLIERDRDGTSQIRIFSEPTHGNAGLPNILARYKDDVLEFLGDIDWEKVGMLRPSPVEASHPLSDIFDAVRFIKRELDTLVEEKNRNEKDLLKEIERLKAARKEILSNMSHELLTPLHAILNYSRYGIDKIESVSQERLYSYFAEINKSASDLYRLIDDLVEISGLESGETKFNIGENDLWSIVGKVVPEFLPKAREKSIRLDVEPPGAPKIARCDRQGIEIVMRQLFDNAVQFTPQNGRIAVYFDEERNEPDDGLIKATCVYVEDSGPGVPEEERERIFEKFAQSSETKNGAGGKGLGLAICKSIVDAHQGQIRVENRQDGHGSVFVVSLPAKAPGFQA